MGWGRGEGAMSGGLTSFATSFATFLSNRGYPTAEVAAAVERVIVVDEGGGRDMRGEGGRGEGREDAVTLWKVEHASGSTCKWCAFYLAQRYENGDGGVEQDGARAMELYHEAAEKRGNSEAMNKLGTIYRLGELGVERDRTRALNYYRSASDAGCARASGRLATFYEYGCNGASFWHSRQSSPIRSHFPANGVDINLEEAARLFKISKERDTTGTAMWTVELDRVNAMIADLRSLYEGGEDTLRGLNHLKTTFMNNGTIEDMAYYGHDIQKAAAFGYRPAIAVCKWYGRGWGWGSEVWDRDREGAVALWKAEHASGSTCKWCACYLAWCYWYGLGGVEKDEAGAVKLLHEAADQRGNSVAMNELGGCYAKGLLGVEVDEGKALNYCRSASNAGCVCALGNLAHFHENGGNLEEAARLFKIAKERDIMHKAMWTEGLDRINAKIAAERQQQGEENQGDEQ